METSKIVFPAVFILIQYICELTINKSKSVGLNLENKNNFNTFKFKVIYNNAIFTADTWSDCCDLVFKLKWHISLTNAKYLSNDSKHFRL